MLISSNSLFSPFEIQWHTADAVIESLYQQTREKYLLQGPVIVLDDDPTGIQTVNGVNVYMKWSLAQLVESIQEESLFFIQTNSRSLTQAETTTLHHDIMNQLFEASAIAGKSFTLISRGDSKLRGHYPLEPDCIRQAYTDRGIAIDGEILIPYFKDAGRLTCNDIHYVVTENAAVPVSETEFSKDPVFAYNYSDLKAYIEEKTLGKCTKDSVVSITLDDIRALNFEGIEQQLKAAENNTRIVVNALNDNDLKVFCIALMRATSKGKKFIFRTAASFVKIYGNIQDKGLLRRQDMPIHHDRYGLLTIVGSHVKATTQQLEILLTAPESIPIEIDVQSLIASETAFEARIAHAVEKVKTALHNGKNPVVFTSRKVVKVNASLPDENNLNISKKVSAALSKVVQQTADLANCVLSKGGITSSDVAVNGLGIEKAKVIGQVLPGVPVIYCAEKQRLQVIFPGNVGSPDALKTVYELLIE